MLFQKINNWGQVLLKKKYSESVQNIAILKTHQWFTIPHKFWASNRGEISPGKRRELPSSMGVFLGSPFFFMLEF